MSELDTPKGVLELAPGDLVDLEGDPYADPTGDDNVLAHEYAVVDKVEQETPDCVLVYFLDYDAVGFPNDHTVPVYDVSKDQAKVAGGVAAAVSSIIDRGGNAPSKDVQREGAWLVMGRKISRHVGPAALYDVEGEGGRYPVTVVFANSDDDAAVTHGECGCKAGRSGTTCKHLIGVLAQLHAQGHSLQV